MMPTPLLIEAAGAVPAVLWVVAIIPKEESASSDLLPSLGCGIKLNNICTAVASLVIVYRSGTFRSRPNDIGLPSA
jgi:hypothetical protein